VWSAVRLRANIVGILPVGVFRRDPGTGRGPRPRRRNGVLAQPSAQFDIMSWLHAGQVALDLRGNNYGRIVARDPRTYLPTQIELVHPDDGAVSAPRKTAASSTRFAGKVVDTFDVWHERQNEVPGSVVGHVPDHRRRPRAGDHRRRRGLRRRILRPTPAPLGAVVLRRADRRGPGEDRQTPGVLGPSRAANRSSSAGTGSTQTLSISPTDALLLEVLRYGREQVAQLFDVPGELIGAPAQGSS
jgi:hypothetical protein